MPDSLQASIARIYNGSQYLPVTQTLLIPAPFAGSLGSGPMDSAAMTAWVDTLLDDLAWGLPKSSDDGTPAGPAPVQQN